MSNPRFQELLMNVSLNEGKMADVLTACIIHFKLYIYLHLNSFTNLYLIVPRIPQIRLEL